MAIEWRDGMATGLYLIDDDHKKLIEISNQIIELLTEIPNKDNQEASAEIHQAFHLLHDYTKTHFRREEMLMRAIGYEETKQHIVHHQDMVKILIECYNSYKKTKETSEFSHLLTEISEVLRHWLVDQVIKEDLKMKPAARVHLMYGIGQPNHDDDEK